MSLSKVLEGLEVIFRLILGKKKKKGKQTKRQNGTEMVLLIGESE